MMILDYKKQNVPIEWLAWPLGDVWRFFWRGELTSMPRLRDSKRRSTWRPLPETPGTPFSFSSCIRTSGPSHLTVNRQELIFVKTALFILPRWYFERSIQCHRVSPASLSILLGMVRTTSGTSFRGIAWKPKSCEPFELGRFQRPPSGVV